MMIQQNAQAQRAEVFVGRLITAVLAVYTIALVAQTAGVFHIA